MGLAELSALYDYRFFSEWGPSNTDYVRSAEIVAEAVFSLFKPRRLADLGCGCGVYSRFFALKGVETLSVDGSPPPREHSFPVEVHARDLTEKFTNAWGRFDLTLCLEVAEHIPEELAGRFLENITSFGDTLLLSAAPPGQGGFHHVNERPRRYWAGRLRRLGFAYDRRASGTLCERLKKARPPHMWMGMHIGVYRRAENAARLNHGLPFNVHLDGPEALERKSADF